MSAARARRLIFIALALSLLLHLLLAGVIRWPSFPQAKDERRLATVHIARISRIAPHTPPPATPQPAPLATPLVRASVRPPSVAPHGKGPAHIATVPVPARTPGPRVTIAPAPAASATPAAACSGAANIDPALVTAPQTGDISPEARASKTNGTSAIRVSLDAQGRVLDAAVAQTSGNAGLDTVAEQMARDATYSPKYIACKAVAGQYTFTVKFVAW